MIKKTLILLFCGLLLLSSIGICSAVSPTTMPITPGINTSAPYGDDKFKALVDPVIKGLTTTKLTSTERMDLQSVYYQAAAMKVSKEFYPVATNITKLLFYLVSANENMDEYNDDTGLGAFDENTRANLLEQAKIDAAAAEKAWYGLTTAYPNSTLYKK